MTELEVAEAALNTGLECARKAARKFAKKGLLVGMMMMMMMRSGAEQATGDGQFWRVLESWRRHGQLNKT